MFSMYGTLNGELYASVQTVVVFTRVTLYCRFSCGKRMSEQHRLTKGFHNVYP